MERRHNFTTLSPSNSMLVPYARRQLSAAPPITSTTSLKIPAGWGVEQVPRPDGSRTDRVHHIIMNPFLYYYEPGTRSKFRSIREVHRYLNGGKRYPCRRSTRISTYNHSSQHQKMIVSGGKSLRMDGGVSQSHLAIVPSGPSASMSYFNLPDGWIVEEVPRRYDRLTDKYYYEPGTGRKFRSLVSIERHLVELEENVPLSKALEEIKENKQLSKVFKLENLTKISKKKVPKESTQASSFMDPPMKVKWVIASPQGDTWNPFICEALVPDAVKQQWTNRFMPFMKDGKQ